MRASSFFVMVLACTVACTAMAAETPVRVLILSGRNNHDWKTTTPFLKSMYEESGRFQVEVTENPASCTQAMLAEYDVIVDDWSAYPEMTGRQWGEVAEQAVLDFVRQGGGFVLSHAATACFADWPEFLELSGCAWRDGAGHSAVHSFDVSVVDREHPVTAGIRDFTGEADELYHSLELHPDARVLCSAYSDPEKNGTGRYEPVLVAMEHGAGRCAYNILGHDTTAMAGAGYRTLMLRATEWAATGKVTIPIPDSLRDSGERKLRIPVLVGGHSYDEEAFKVLFDSLKGIDYEFTSSSIQERPDDFPYDAIVMYNSQEPASEALQQGFLQLLERGVGVVILHHAIVTYNNWPVYWDIAGGRFLMKDTEIDGKTYPPSVWKHDVDFGLHIVDRAHPVTGGIQDFRVVDETYGLCSPYEDNHVLITTDDPTSDPEICWARTYKNARICYIQVGHGPHVFRDANYQRLVQQAIHWVAASKPSKQTQN